MAKIKHKMEITEDVNKFLFFCGTLRVFQKAPLTLKSKSTNFCISLQQVLDPPEIF